MKHQKKLQVLIAFAISIFLLSCGTAQTASEKADKAQEINNIISNLDFKFSATYAYPQSYGSIYLSPYYDVRVSPDTINAYLPYYGRAYRAPMDSNEGGIKFESTKFEYDVEKGKKQGNWLITIHTKDTSRPFTLHFDLWDNGTGRLDVQDPDRQSISFQGIVEPRKKAK
jgi:hypothetical protein